MTTDRTDIKSLLGAYFPTMEAATSDEWHFFLDKVTGIETPLDMPNGQAFDRWRLALAKQGYPVFKYSDQDVAEKKAKAAAMLQAEETRAASMGKTLSDLAKEAPNWTAAEVLASQKG
jgi:hypothetical protein